jgi:CDP-diacylglycerol--glycerol-3-phosphate 3-phosphatidyltransferase
MGDGTDDLARWRALHPAREGLATRVAEVYLPLPYAIARRLVRVHPNLVTLAGLLLAVATIPAYRPRGVAALLILLAGVADSVDGAVAVVSGRVTAFGAVWDSTADRLADVAILVGPALHEPGAAFVAAGAGTFLLEYVRARSSAVGAAGQRVTPGERPSRIVLLALGAATGWWAAAAWTVAALTVLGAALLLNDARARPTRPVSG